MKILKYTRSLLDFLFPEHCLGCDKYDTPLCVECIREIPRVTQTELPYAQALFSYKHPYIKDSIWKMKYQEQHEVAVIFGKLLGKKILKDISLSKDEVKYVLVPIPLTPKRTKERGYNQSAWICEGILDYIEKHKSSDLKIQYTEKLITRDNTKQTQARTKKKSIRLTQAKGTFHVATSKISKNAYIILIDDVTTTGATFTEARNALQSAGVENVIAYSVAH